MTFDDGSGALYRPAAAHPDRQRRQTPPFFLIGNKVGRQHPPAPGASRTRAWRTVIHTWEHPSNMTPRFRPRISRPILNRANDVIAAATGPHARRCIARPADGVTMRYARPRAQGWAKP
ncbi:hypothetical protein [Mycobacterium tuberculosis]|uniref:hypothetical protein n=1 Tax=Mycobacterium tuberculosis TaxID=1773 RepID=UPI0035A16F5B